MFQVYYGSGNPKNVNNLRRLPKADNQHYLSVGIMNDVKMKKSIK